jgi:hypothetical protein
MVTDLSGFVPPLWAVPLYIFEATCLGLTLFLVWLVWPVIKADLRSRLGLAPKEAPVTAPPVGR